ncbi:ABC transporter Adp1 [Raphidocelis subcapitata]|uniref:ABC transporter Adp1 n=1 Tax=Raphidocelis subcapitata TaxID=307507 RepID=A0A2V0NRS2_9CHLO|nr:ABC transporter Adp1 [Raphidocelis subcapitata]|eukprot:GBF87535.1 ABC transporter Adp1 [Raphidocelis subcapitata]
MAPLGRPGRLVLVLAIAVLFACAGRTAAAEGKYCVVDARLDPGGSARFGGDVTSPLAAEVKTIDAAAPSGSVAIVFPTATCPTAAGLAAALPAAFLAGPPGGAGGIRISRLEARVELSGTQLGTISVQGFSGTLLSKAPLGASGAAPLVLEASGGRGLVKSDLVAARELDLSELPPLPGSGCSASAAPGGRVRLDCPRLVVSGPLETPEVAGTLRLLASFSAEGSLAGARLVDAAAFARAPALRAQPPAVPRTTASGVGTGGSSSVGTAAGVKASGVSAGSISIGGASSGSGSSGGAGGGSSRGNAAGAKAAVPAAGAQLPPRCKAPGGLGGCVCEDGWAGDACLRCTAPIVCPALTGQPFSTCSDAMEYSTRTAYKAYSCSVKGGLSALVRSITGVCNVRGRPLPFKEGPLGLKPGAMFAASPPGAAFCRLVVSTSQDPANPLHCTGTQCTFEEGKPGFICARTSCSCPAKNHCVPLVQGIIDKLANGSVGIDCRASGDCTLTGLQPQLELSCAAGECTQPDLAPAPLPSLRGAPAKPFPVVALLACLVPVILTVLGSLGLAYVVVTRRLFAAGCRGGRRSSTSDGGGGDAAAAAPLLPPSSHALALPPAAVAAVEASGAASKRALAKSMTEGQSGSQRPAVPAAAAAAASHTCRGRPLPADVLGLPVRFEFENVYCAVPDRSADKPKRRARARAAAGDASPERPATPRFQDAEGRRQKVLLHGVSGSIAEGEVVGVMGPSGAGKSTLLSILSGATESVGAGARVEGAVTLGGEARRSALRKITAFVPQRDVLLPALTVEECVRYSALLRLPRSLAAEEVQERINGVLSELGLSHVAASLVGGSASIRGVSGGERRRVTIAMALVTRPRLVIMDEPTSGLDSYTACNLMRTAHDIAGHGRVVVMSLHQPSPDMFDSLTQVLLLAKGRLAYLGPPSGVAPYFAAAGHPAPAGRQPAEHMLHVASQAGGLAALLQQARAAAAARPVEPPAGSFLQQGRGGFAGCSPRSKATRSLFFSADGSRSGRSSADEEWTLAAAAAVASQGGGGGGSATSSEAGSAPGTPGGGRPAPMALHAFAAGRAAHAAPHASSLLPHSAAAVAAAAAAAAPTPTPRRRAARAAGHWLGGQARECAVLYWRAFTNMRREPRLLLLHIVVAAALGLVVGAVFFRLDSSNVGLQNRLGAMFFALALFGWTSVSVVDGLVLERELVEREVAGHYYGGGTYLLSSLVLDGLLLRTLPALLFSGLMYPMVGLLPEASRVVTFMFVLATYTCTVGALTTALTALCRSSSATTLAMNIILLIWVLIGGYLVNPSSIPRWLRWVRSLSPLSFAFEVLAANEMADQFFSIHVDGFPEIGGIKGDVFLRTLGLDPSRTLQSAGALAAFYGGSVALAFAATSYTLWRHSGGSWRAVIFGSRGAPGAGRGGAAHFSQQLPGAGSGVVARRSVDAGPAAPAAAAAAAAAGSAVAAAAAAAPVPPASARERAVIQVDVTAG